MKLTILSRFATAAALLIATQNLHSQVIQPPPNPYQYQWRAYDRGPFYVEGDLGAAFMQSTKFRNTATGTSTGISFDPGIRESLIFGYQVVSPFAVEFETGAIWNHMNTGAQPFPTLVNHGDLYQVPILANAVFSVPLNNGISLYLGAGAGGVASELAVSQRIPNGMYTYHHDDSSTDFTFAYQGKAGVKFAIARNMDVDLGYKFLGTLHHTWFEDDPTLYVHSGATYSHAIMASFTWHF